MYMIMMEQNKMTHNWLRLSIDKTMTSCWSKQNINRIWKNEIRLVPFKNLSWVRDMYVHHAVSKLAKNWSIRTISLHIFQDYTHVLIVLLIWLFFLMIFINLSGSFLCWRKDTYRGWKFWQYHSWLLNYIWLHLVEGYLLTRVILLLWLYSSLRPDVSLSILQ